MFTTEVNNALGMRWPTLVTGMDIIAGFRSPFKDAGQFNVFNVFPPLVSMLTRESVWYSVTVCVVACRGCLDCAFRRIVRSLGVALDFEVRLCA